MRNKKNVSYKPNISFVSAPCGSGKTHAAATYIRDHRHENNFIYVAPSLGLIAETKQLHLDIGVTPTAIGELRILYRNFISTTIKENLYVRYSK